ncbi:MAG: asparagine synthase (glutamine-hydrolyzing) [Bryobacteraceae bacterium]
MCGIAGYLTHDSAAALPVLRAMCDQIRHRGPDDEGYRVDGRCGLGMRRLSIIDLATGHQPISNEDGTVSIVFNGEIYNYQALRQELIAAGHVFATNSDTETLVHLYEQEGTAGIAKLRGMFAYALWDSRAQKLLLVRDRLGKKPLYYAALADGFYFASEIKCLKAAGVPANPEREALRLYLELGYVPEPWSAFEGIRKLPPGSWLTCDAAGKIEQGSYWEMPAPCERVTGGLTREAACREIRRVFDEAVRLRMIADVPLGAFLSGGIDSSLVVASMARQSPRPVQTFSIGFKNSEYNELPAAAAAARHFGADHHELILEPDSIALVTRLVESFDEPFADDSALATFMVSQFAAQHVKVVLTGDGGDEFFGGYGSFFDADRRRVFDRLPQAARRALAFCADRLPYEAYGKNYLRMMSRPSSIERYFEFGIGASYFLRERILNPEWILDDSEESLRARFGRAILPPGAGVLSEAMQFEATVKLTGDILAKVDRMSMAHSLEVRCPLLDHELIELASRIPNSWKTRNGCGKLILLEALGDRLPAELLNRPKRGFGVPLAEWFRGPLRSFVWDRLMSSTFLGRGIARGPFLRKMLEEHDAARRDNSYAIWLLLMLELWFRRQETPPRIEPASALAENAGNPLAASGGARPAANL